MTKILYLPTGRYLKFLSKSPYREVKPSDLSENLELSLSHLIMKIIINL